MTDPDSYYTAIDIPGLRTPGNLFLAPMAGWSDAAFRSLCIDFGASFCYTEMVSAAALARGNYKTLSLLKRAENELLLGVQIFASDPHSAARAVQAILPYRPSLIDLNCGCAVPKIIKSGCGAVLLKNPPKIREIVRIMSQESPVPVSVKLRSGWDNSSINFLETASMAREGGASLVSLHPRTRVQAFSGRAELLHIRLLKAELDIPVIGSGDLFSAEDALTMIRETRCDGVMFARGALGNPFIFDQARALLSGKPRPASPDKREKVEAAFRQLQRAIALKGEERACKEMRKHFSVYLRGFPGAAGLRSRIVTAESETDYRLILDGLL